MVLRQRPWREWQIILGRYRLHDPPSQPVIENKHPSTDRFVEICWSSIAILLCLFTHLSFYFILFPSFLPWSWFKVNNSNHWISHFTHPHMQIVSVASLLCQCWFQVYLSWCLKSAKSAAKFSSNCISSFYVFCSITICTALQVWHFWVFNHIIRIFFFTFFFHYYYYNYYYYSLYMYIYIFKIQDDAELPKIELNRLELLSVLVDK